MGAVFVIGSSIAYATIVHPNVDTHHNFALQLHHHHHVNLEEGHGNTANGAMANKDDEELDEEDICYNYCTDCVKTHSYGSFLTRFFGDKNNK